MRPMIRIAALLLIVALLATPLGATVCAGHCVQPQAAAAAPVSHCGSTTAEAPSVGIKAGNAQSARLTAMNPCGVKSVPTVLKAGDDASRWQLVQAASPIRIAVTEIRAFISTAPQDTSPPGLSAPHLTPLRI